MRRAAPLASAFALLLATPGHPQPVPHRNVPGVADVPAGPATLRVRVEHPGGPEAAAGLPIVLYALPPDAEPGLRGGATDARGELRFEGLSNDPETAYLVGVSYADVPFGTRFRFAPGETEREVVLAIAEPTADAGAVRVGEVRLRLEPACAGAHVVESYELRNPGQRVIIVPGEARGAILEAELPEAAVGFSAGPAAQGLVRDGGRVRFLGPLHPGTQVVELGYGLPPGALALRRSFPGGAERVVLLTPEGSPPARGAALRPGEPVTDGEGRRWSAAVAEDLAPGASLEFTVDLPEGAPAAPGVSLRRAQLWLELDEAALRVDERYDLEGGHGAPATAPLLCLPLPDGAEELRFSSATLAMGPSLDPSGGLAVRGPLPPGPSVLSLRYLLPADGAAFELARRFSVSVPLLSMYVADTGISADSERMHRRRPVLGDDRTWMHFEAFAIAPGESVSLRLQALPASGRVSRGAVALFLAVAALLSVVVLVGPLPGGRPEAAPHRADGSLEREAVDAALRDLDHDYETGKLAREDYEAFRRELRARAEALSGEPGGGRPA